MDINTNHTYRFLLVPGEAMLDSFGFPLSDGTKCTECTEVWIEGLVNFERVVKEHEERRLARSYKFYSDKDQILPVLDIGGPIESGDYLIRSFIPGYFQKGSVQHFSSRPFGISKETCSFQPAWVPVYRNKKIQKEISVEVPIEKEKSIRKYSLVKEWNVAQEKWVGTLVSSVETQKEPVYRMESIYDEHGVVIDTMQVPKTETQIEIREEDEVDEQGNIVQEIVGETLEYQLQYVNSNGHFEPEYREGIYKMHYVKVDVVNYCF
jgi:hypothetical protein